MKKVTISELREGDIFYYKDRYYEVVSNPPSSFKRDLGAVCKCFMSPSHPDGIGIGTVTFAVSGLWVLLCEKD